MTSTLTWNPADNVGPFLLTMSNLRASANGVTGNIGVRATAPVSSGKYYAEYLANADFHTYYDGAGVVRPDVTIPDNVYAGTNGVSVGNNGAVVVNGVNIITSYFFGGNTHVYRQAYDHDAALFWSSIDGGDWNNDPTANPATGTGGVSVAGSGSINGHSAVPYIASSTGNPDFTARWSSSDWTYSAPSGFSEWPGAGPTEVDIPTSTHSLGVDMAASISFEKYLSATNGLGVDMSVLLGSELGVPATNHSLGVTMAATLTRELSLITNMSLGVSMAAALAHASSARRQPVVCITT